MLIGNNIALVLYGLVFSGLLSPQLAFFIDSELIILIIITLISIVLILLVAEFLPKTVFITAPNFFLKNLSIPTLFFYMIFSPVSKFILATANFFIRMFFGIKGGKKTPENLVFCKTDPDHFRNQSKQSLENPDPLHNNFRIFQNALDFSRVKLRECMVPRTEIAAIDCNGSIDELRQKFIETGFSRILVYDESIDNIIGYFELKDIFKNPPDIRSSLRKLAIVPESMPASRLLKMFVDERKNISLVVDEFGGTSGVVTIEDVLEEIVGDIEDEHDNYDLTEKMISSNEYIFSGRLEIDYLNEKYNLQLPEEDDFETLAGMILYFHGSIPGNNDVIRIGNIVIKVLRATATRLELVSMKVE
jgi:CBS domain containing-hemolysin-like protein